MADDSDWGALQEAAERLGERADEAEAPQEAIRGNDDEHESKFEGKRADRHDAPHGDDHDEAMDEDNEVNRPPVRKSAGWGAEDEGGDEHSGSAGGAGAGASANASDEGKSADSIKKSKRRSAARDGLMTDLDASNSEDDAAAKSKSKHKEAERDDGGDITIIPDLDEDQEEDLQLQVAEAPANVRSVQTLRELDRQINGLQIPNASGDDQRLDLSILSRVLVPRDRLEEPDEAWDFDQLLEQVSQEMTRQKESSEAFERSRAETSAPAVQEGPAPETNPALSAN